MKDTISPATAVTATTVPAAAGFPVRSRISHGHAISAMELPNCESPAEERYSHAEERYSHAEARCRAGVPVVIVRPPYP
ncbi:hypothetical protein [Corynebacterium antarcticum]|uniref:hypothetical protein n=1 Tax=Corynebacterium antarcticum TaxID=2800405 RepID=UPI002260FA01|nr:hypothetical protein [Corynebacterium antarcticum]MCX7540869.1 hypothetical protein [Corynebacterium antarcticum]